MVSWCQPYRILEVTQSHQVPNWIMTQLTLFSFSWILSVNDISELEICDAILYSNTNSCILNLNVSWICLPIPCLTLPSCHPSFPYWLESWYLHHTFTGLGLWPPDFFSSHHSCVSESYTPIAPQLSVCNFQLVSSLVKPLPWFPIAISSFAPGDGALWKIGEGQETPHCARPSIHTAGPWTSLDRGYNMPQKPPVNVTRNAHTHS